MDHEEIVRRIIAHAQEVVPELEGRAIGPQDSLRDLGANSVDRAEIVMMTMETLALNIPRVELFGAQNIGELADLCTVKLAERNP